jgi:uroporphyrinogen-III synthase
MSHGRVPFKPELPQQRRVLPQLQKSAKALDVVVMTSTRGASTAFARGRQKRRAAASLSEVNVVGMRDASAARRRGSFQCQGPHV